jgi:hypothetical protein
MTLDPAKFIVRDPRYPQLEDYPSFCVGVVKDLLKIDPPPSANQLVEFIREAIITKGSYERLHATLEGDDITRYGNWRDKEAKDKDRITILEGKLTSSSGKIQKTLFW